MARLTHSNWFVEIIWCQERRLRLFEEARRVVARKRVDGYIRVARIDGWAGDGFISPEVQRAQIEAFAGLMGVELDAWHDDQDCSGGNVERPGFLEVIRRIEAAAAQDPDLRQPLPGGWFRATAHVCRHDA